jgi:hypothetical protein
MTDFRFELPQDLDFIAVERRARALRARAVADGLTVAALWLQARVAAMLSAMRGLRTQQDRAA